MNRILKAGFGLALATAGLLAVTAANAQVTVGYYTDFNAGDTGPNAPIVANGYTPVHILNIGTYNFGLVDIVMIDEENNGNPSAALLGREGDLATYVNGGGVVVIHDRNVQNNALIPGGSGIALHRDFTFGADLNVVTGGTLVTNGPFGTINNTTLDGGNSSSHGYADVSSLPAGAITFLSNGPSASHSAAFEFNLGAGHVYYSTIPLDFYLDGNGPAPHPANDFRNIYAPNVLAYAGSLLAPAVPEPGSVAMMVGLGFTGLFFRLRRRR